MENAKMSVCLSVRPCLSVWNTPINSLNGYMYDENFNFSFSEINILVKDSACYESDWPQPMQCKTSYKQCKITKKMEYDFADKVTHFGLKQAF